MAYLEDRQDLRLSLREDNGQWQSAIGRQGVALVGPEFFLSRQQTGGRQNLSQGLNKPGLGSVGGVSRWLTWMDSVNHDVEGVMWPIRIDDQSPASIHPCSSGRHRCVWTKTRNTPDYREENKILLCQGVHPGKFGF